MGLMSLLLYISSTNAEHLFALLVVLRVREFIQPLLPFINLIRLFLGRGVVLFLSLIDNPMMLWLPHWRNIVLYLGIH